jgi:hypothetical protein
MPGTELRGTVRRNPRAEAQFEMDKAAPMLAAFEGVTKFAAARWQASQEAQFNEAALAIEEGMREAEYTLSKTKDIYNVLDGDNLWQNSMDELRDATISSVPNRSLQRKLKYSFEQNEIAARFRLRGEIDKKILAREQAAIAARMEKKRYNLSQPGTTIDQYDTEMNIVTNDQARGVAGGRYSIEGVTKANLQLRADIAASYIQNVYGNDPDKAMQLFAMLELQDEVITGEKTPEQAMAAAGIDDEYALHVLYNVERGTAVKIIQDNLATSLKFYDAKEKLETDLEQDRNNLNEKAYNFAISLEDGEIIDKEVVKSLVPEYFWQDYPAMTIQGNTIAGANAKRVIRNFLENDQMWASPEQQEKLSQSIDQTSRSVFATKDTEDLGKVIDLEDKAAAGMLTLSELQENKAFLQPSTYRAIRDRIYNEEDEGYAAVKAAVAAKFKYDEQSALNGNLAEASRNAFINVTREILDERNRRQIEQNPMTLLELVDLANKKADEFDDIYRAELTKEYERTLKKFEKDFNNGQTIFNRRDPFGSGDEWFGSLSDDRQGQIQVYYGPLLSNIRNKFSGLGLFDE